MIIASEKFCGMNFCGLCTTGNCAECDRKIAKDEAIKALEELQVYRSIGTPEECRNSVLDIPKAYNKAIDDFSELLKGNLLQKYANARHEQQYVALQVTDWCDDIAGRLKVVMEDEID